MCGVRVGHKTFPLPFERILFIRTAVKSGSTCNTNIRSQGFPWAAPSGTLSISGCFIPEHPSRQSTYILQHFGQLAGRTDGSWVGKELNE